MLHENGMNVTLKLPDELCKAAKHRAVDESLSLSKWIAQLVERELAAEPRPRKSLMDIIAVKDAPDSFYEKELPLEDRKAHAAREIDFFKE